MKRVVHDCIVPDAKKLREELYYFDYSTPLPYVYPGITRDVIDNLDDEGVGAKYQYDTQVFDNLCMRLFF